MPQTAGTEMTLKQAKGRTDKRTNRQHRCSNEQMSADADSRRQL